MKLKLKRNDCKEELKEVTKERDILLSFFAQIGYICKMYLQTAIMYQNNDLQMRLNDFTGLYNMIAVASYYKKPMDDFVRRRPQKEKNVKEFIDGWNKHAEEVVIPTYLNEIARLSQEYEKVTEKDKKDDSPNYYR